MFTQTVSKVYSEGFGSLHGWFYELAIYFFTRRYKREKKRVIAICKKEIEVFFVRFKERCWLFLQKGVILGIEKRNRLTLYSV
ncbi:hypothetical protein HQ36_08280 [Porphyromonas gingivicanis]|uniref:Uncharacterized protein n=1 Tax=Porphyromonas gingivicanis TaxID=266762 RepID=A0A0A2G3J2_9PORP|nr:hypothetical protein HQ36_08280 [Porphyromonas gingivicanis]